MKTFFFTNLNAICAVLLMALCISSCSEKEHKLAEDFEIVYTTDVHGALLNQDFLRQEEAKNSLANVMAYVRQQRQNPECRLILLDDGDILQGDPSMYYYNVQAIREEHLASRVYNYMGYDAITLGNHDFECGESVYYDHFFKQTNAKMLAANAIDTRNNKPMFLPYMTIEQGDFKICVLGITNPGVTNWLSKAMYPHLRFESIKKSTLEWTRKIQEEEKPDMLIVMFHAGHEKPEFVDEQGESFIDGVEEVIAESHGIDLAFIGHDHKWDKTKLVDADGDSVPVIQPKSHAEQFASVKFRLSHEPESQHTTITFDGITLEDSWRYTADPEYCNTFANDVKIINDYLDTPLGAISDTLDGRGILVGQTNLMDFIHEVQLNKTGADISMASALSSFCDIPSGHITMRQLFDIYKYENQLNKVWMTGEEVKKFLEWGYGQQFTYMRSSDDHLLSFKLDPTTKEVIIGSFGPELATPQYNFTSAAGINYTVDVSKPAGNRVTIESMADGSPFEMDHRYIVVLTSFQASGGGGFIRKGLGWNDADIRYHSVTESIKDMRYFIGQHIHNIGTVQAKKNGSWRVIPEAWWRANKDEDIALLLPYLKH